LIKERGFLNVKKFKFTVSKKLYLGFSSIIVLLIALLAFSYFTITNVNQGSHNVFQRANENYMWQKIDTLTANLNASYLGFVASRDFAYITKANDQGSEIIGTLIQMKEIVPPQRAATLASVTALAPEVVSLGKTTVLSITNQDSGAYNENKPKWEAKQNQLSGLIEEAVAASKDDSVGLLEASDATAQQALIYMGGICLVAILFALFIAFLISRNVSTGVNGIKNAMQKMASGDLTAKIKIKSSDEFGQIARSYDEMRQHWINLVSQLKHNSVQLTQASDQLAVAAKQSSESTQQVATSAQQMARGAQEQSNNAQETAKSIEQLSGVISQLSQGAQEQTTSVQNAIYSITEVSETMTVVAQNAAKAAQGAKQAAESAVTGAEKSKQTLSGMEKIKTTSLDVAKKIEELGARSAEIGKIVAVIDDIAAQTNLLALNAAIEAARAGEQGRGFAVVSDEVRKLAERSAAATKEIADLIGSIQKGVKEATQVTLAGSNAVTEGFKMAKEAGQSLEQIMQAASAVNDQVDLIAQKAQQVNTSTNALVKTIDAVGAITETNSTATEQMTASAAQVSKSIETVAGIAEENSAATEEVSASAEEMSAQVQEIVSSSQILKEMAVSLEKSVSSFKVVEDNTPLMSDQPGAVKGLSKETSIVKAEVGGTAGADRSSDQVKPPQA
jgi:methyl-accepting chemotaxis protein